MTSNRSRLSVSSEQISAATKASQVPETATLQHIKRSAQKRFVKSTFSTQHEPEKTIWLIAGSEWSSFTDLFTAFWENLTTVNSQIFEKSPYALCMDKCPQSNVKSRSVSKAIQTSHCEFSWGAMTTTLCGRPPQLGYLPLQRGISLSHPFIQSFTHSALMQSLSFNTQLHTPIKFTRNNPLEHLTHKLGFLQNATNHFVWENSHFFLQEEKTVIPYEDITPCKSLQATAVPRAQIQHLMNPMVFSSLVQWLPKPWGWLLFVASVLIPTAASKLKRKHQH